MCCLDFLLSPCLFPWNLGFQFAKIYLFYLLWDTSGRFFSVGICLLWLQTIEIDFREPMQLELYQRYQSVHGINLWLDLYIFFSYFLLSIDSLSAGNSLWCPLLLTLSFSLSSNAVVKIIWNNKRDYLVQRISRCQRQVSSVLVVLIIFHVNHSVKLETF